MEYRAGKFRVPHFNSGMNDRGALPTGNSVDHGPIADRPVQSQVSRMAAIQPL